MTNLVSIGSNHGVTGINYSSKFGLSVKEYIDLCNADISEKGFRRLPYPEYYVRSSDGKNYMPIGEGQYIAFAIEIGKLNVKGVLDFCDTAEAQLYFDEEIDTFGVNQENKKRA